MRPVSRLGAFPIVDPKVRGQVDDAELFGDRRDPFRRLTVWKSKEEEIEVFHMIWPELFQQSQRAGTETRPKLGKLLTACLSRGSGHQLHFGVMKQ